MLRVARWETTRGAGNVDRRTLLVALALLLVAGSVLGAGLAAGVVGLQVDRDVYRVGVDPGSPYAEAVADEPALRSVPLDDARLGETADVVVIDRSITDEATGDSAVLVAATDSAKGEAAAAAFSAAVEAHNERLMAVEANTTAAFPLTVTLEYVSRTSAAERGVTLGDEKGGDSAADTVDDEGGDVDDGATDAAADTTDADTDPTDAERRSSGDELAAPSIGGGAGGLFGAKTVGSPGAITPPFPFVSLLLAFVFLVPMNFLIQAYGSSILAERTNRRGEPLLVTPLSPVEIVTGKTLPYLGAATLVTALIAVAVGGGVLSVVAVLPIAVTFLATTFVGAMFARSFKELTFVTVGVSVLLTTYAFVPAIFTNITPIALVSPLTLVVFDLQGAPVSLTQTLFATTPMTIGAILLYGLGLGVYREEDMFTQKPIGRKVLDALAVRLTNVPSTDASNRYRQRLRPYAAIAALTACTIPFVFVAELLAVALLFALPITVSIPVLLVTIAFIEELAKSLHLYAGFERDVFARTDRVAIAVGLASAIGFFLAEKTTAVVQAVGLTDLFVGRAAFGAAAGVGELSGPLLLALFFAPLLLHGVATGLASIGASRNRASYAVAIALATLIHAAYNFGVVSIHG